MHLGIDLGTTYSLIARVDAHGTPVLFPDLHDADRFKTPSVVHVGPDGALVGQPVEELLEEIPELPVVRFVKLKMGSNEPVFRDHLGRDWLPETISALILRKLQRDVQAFSDEPIESLIISVPAHFTDVQRRACWQAGRLAGLNVVDLVEEPPAAAIHYGAHSAAAESTFLVYDMGGGTFDATVLRAGPDGLYALATEGAADLGGKNFDDSIMDLIAGQFVAGHGDDPRSDLAALGIVRRHAEAMKIKLASPGRSEIRTAMLLAGRTQEILLTRGHLDRICGPLIERSIAVCEATLKAAGLDWPTLDHIMLAGGSTLLPLVEAGLRKASGKPPDKIRRHQPHNAIAYGAALVAAQRAGVASGGTPQLRQRITGFDLGFRVLDPRARQAAVDTVIPKNSPIPAQKSRTYFSNRADQERMIFEIVQVKESGGPASSLGHFAFKLNRPRKNHPLEVTLGYDEHGMVTVVARDPSSDEAMRCEFEDASGQQSDGVSGQAELLRETRLCQ